CSAGEKKLSNPVVPAPIANPQMALPTLVNVAPQRLEALLAVVLARHAPPPVVVALVVRQQILRHGHNGGANATDCGVAGYDLVRAREQPLLVPLRARARLPRHAAEVAELGVADAPARSLAYCLVEG
ncbi:hypothetical protein LTR16_011371, partial [Cryomyces antarcticus]